MKLIVPEHLHRNEPNTAAAGFEHTGQVLIDLATKRLGLKDLQDKDILDVGCGVRFAMTILNREIPIKSYTGLEVNRPIVDFLDDEVASHDYRFQFAQLDILNDMYNPQGLPFSMFDRLPFEDDFDIIWLFSVFTHLNPSDALTMLKILKKYIRNDGKLFFSSFIDEKLSGFEDRVEDRPLLKAYYGKDYMMSLIKEAGWRIDAFYEREPDNFIMDYFVCSPGHLNGGE